MKTYVFILIGCCLGKENCLSLPIPVSLEIQAQKLSMKIGCIALLLFADSTAESDDIPAFVVWIIAACVSGILAVTLVAVLAVFCCRRDGKSGGGGGGDRSGDDEDISRPSQGTNPSRTERSTCDSCVGRFFLDV